MSQPDDLDRWARDTVAAWPPLTAAQRAQLARLLGSRSPQQPPERHLDDAHPKK